MRMVQYKIFPRNNDLQKLEIYCITSYYFFLPTRYLRLRADSSYIILKENVEICTENIIKGTEIPDSNVVHRKRKNGIENSDNSVSVVCLRHEDITSTAWERTFSYNVISFGIL